MFENPTLVLLSKELCCVSYYPGVSFVSGFFLFVRLPSRDIEDDNGGGGGRSRIILAAAAVDALLPVNFVSQRDSRAKGFC